MTATEIDGLIGEVLTMEKNYHIVVYNDEVNSFQHVINCFVIFLGHSYEQAEQCAIIINDKGSCSVKKGFPVKELCRMNENLHYNNIDGRVEEIK